MRQRNRDPRHARSGRKRPFERVAVVHLRSSRQSALRNEAVDGAFLLASERHHHDGEPGELLDRHGAQLPRRARDQNIVILEQQVRLEPLRRGRKCTDRGVDPAEVDLLGEVNPGHRPDDDIDVRGLCPENPKQMRRNDHGRKIVRGDGEFLRRAARIELWRPHRRFQCFQGIANQRGHRERTRGRLHAGGGADEQLVVEHLPQSRERMADGGLAEKDFLARAQHAALFHDRIEDAKQVQVQGC